MLTEGTGYGRMPGARLGNHYLTRKLTTREKLLSIYTLKKEKKVSNTEWKKRLRQDKLYKSLTTG